jgi:16S rRNA processing protein RimM
MSSRSSKTDGRSDPPETIAVGRILRAHGLRGEVAVEVLSDVPRRLAAGSSLLLVREGSAPAPLVVAACRAQGAAPPAGAARRGSRPAVVLVRFAGIDDRERATALRGAWLEVERSRVPPAPPGSYYHFELLGCRCANGGLELGEVVEVVEDGGGLLLIVAAGGCQVPVPFVARFLRSVDVERRRIELDLPPGLLEVCTSRS